MMMNIFERLVPLLCLVMLGLVAVGIARVLEAFSAAVRNFWPSFSQQFKQNRFE